VIYRVSIDTGLCSGFGACVDRAPEAFRLQGGIATVAATTTDPRVLDAAAACPMGAISVESLEAAA